MVNKKKDKETKSKKGRPKKKISYIFSVGRRRQATARVRLYPHKKGEIIVNNQPIAQYFPGKVMEKIYLEPLRTCNVIDKYLITVKIKGSGKIGQVGAFVHGVSRALAKLDGEKFKPILKKRKFLTRDSRMKERRKVGMGGKARRKKQSPKR